MLTDEDIEKIARKVTELQKENEIKNVRSTFRLSNIRNKYHKQIYDKFGTTGNIEDAIRVVAVYKCGQRYISRIPEEKWKECEDYAEQLYKDILEIKESD